MLQERLGPTKRSLRSSNTLIDESKDQTKMWHVHSRFGPGTLLRLSFHDCLRYKDGTGGCDGCLNWHGVDRTNFSEESLQENGPMPTPEAGDGGNNVLGDAARRLEDIYTRPLSAALDYSLKETNKSRADLWALAGIVAVEYTMAINNEVCETGTKMNQKMSKGRAGQCLQAQGEAACKVMPTRPLKFKYGRRDCVTNQEFGYMAEKEEKHPDTQMNGVSIATFMKEEFGLNGRETVAVMGAHTIGTYHRDFTGFKYVWTPRSERSFNNEYYREMVNESLWQFDSDDCTKYGDAWGEKAKGRWVTKVHNFQENHGPVQWIHHKHMAPSCGNRNPKDKQNKDEEDCCTNGVPQGAMARPDHNRPQGSDLNAYDVAWGDKRNGCERFKFLWARDHAMLNTDMGLYLDFQVDENGYPTGCKGFEPNRFSMERVRERNGWGEGWQECGPQQHAEPPDAQPLFKHVEEFATDQQSWVDAYIPTMEKYLENGYQAGDLVAV
eukprot:TRINITY_DN5343_c0_g1_i3.p1 TRINITY_DN5343_c0_g1~~TRINITY_DN5343_c0_g1_i3.p1  ORF type:complete len:495 (+),score=86.48 TRINITY_DN5343_c0_g1_i3:498-1982(+)